MVQATSNSPLNPTIALQALFWSMSVYANDNVIDKSMTDFQYYHFGRYAWIYVVMPCLAAIPAGILAHYHLRADEHPDAMGEQMKKDENKGLLEKVQEAVA